MKKKIVSLALALVMVVLMLVGCGAPSIEELELSDYATFSLEEFKKDLAKIEIEDGSYTNNPKFRDIIVKESVYSSVASAIIKEGKKLYDGKIGANDVVYFCYYTTTDDGTVFHFDQMDVSTVTASSTSKAHVIQLGAVSENDDDYEFNKALLSALSGKDLTDMVYKVNNTKNAVVEVEDGESITLVISYTRSYTDEKGTPDDKTDDETVKQSAKFEEIVLSEDNMSNPLVAALLAEGSVIKLGNKITVKKTVVDDNGTPDDDTDDTSKTEDVSTFEVVIDGITYTYENVQAKWIVEEKGDAGAFTFTYTPFTEEKTEVEPSGLCNAGTKVDLKDKELTYHLFPIYYYDVPEFENDAGEVDDNVIAAAIIKYILADKVALSSFDVFEDTDFKNGDASIKTLAEQLVEIYKLKSSKKWSDASEKLSAYAYIKLLAKLQSGKYELTDEEKSDEAFKDHLAMFELLDTLSDITLVDKINYNDASKSTLTDEEKVTLDAIFVYLKSVTVDVVFEGFFTLSEETVKAVLDLKEEIETTIPGKISAKNDEITAKETEINDKEAELDAMDEVTDAAKAELAALKAELELLKKDLSNLKADLTLKSTQFKTDALKLFSAAKSDAYDNTLKFAIDTKIAEMIAAKSDNGTADDESDDKTVASEVVAEKYEQLAHDNDSSYRQYIADEVAKAVYKLIDKHVKIVSYPEEIVKEFSEHIYEEYEYKFYKEKRENTEESNYKYFKGDIEAFMKDAFKSDDYRAAIEAKAKEYLAPMIKIYVVAEAFAADGAQKKLEAFVNADIAAGVYDAHYKNDDSLSAEENKAAKAEAEEAANENKKIVREDAKYFLIDDEAFKVFKKSQGSSYSDLAEYYGERNLRAALQFNKLFDFLVGTKSEVSEHNGEWHTEPLSREVEVEVEGGTSTTIIEIVFHNDLIKYTVK